MTDYVCRECVAECYLQDALDFQVEAQCGFCGRELGVVTLDELVDHCEAALHASFRYVHQPDSVLIYGREPFGEHLHQVLDKMLRCSDDLVVAIAEARPDAWSDWDDDDPFFNEGISPNSEMSSAWAEMERTLRDEARFVNPTAARVLEEVFGGIEQLQIEGSASILTIGPGLPLDRFKRARVFSNDDAVADALSHPELFLGAPPPGIGGAGRMNAKGVSVFYGATNVQTAIAEVRPPVGSLVVSATFKVTRELRLLNLGALNDIRPDQALSYFQPERMEQGQRCAFLAALRDQLLLPVMPEMVEQGYLITQTIADFLPTHPKLNLDGILFPSIQVSQHGKAAAGHNVILFTKASGVHRCDEIYAAGQVSLWDSNEDGTFFTPEFWPGEDQPGGSVDDFNLGIQPKRYPPALELIRSEISIHQVKGVLFDTKDTEVDYHGDPARCRLKDF